MKQRQLNPVLKPGPVPPASPQVSHVEPREVFEKILRQIRKEHEEAFCYVLMNWFKETSHVKTKNKSPVKRKSEALAKYTRKWYEVAFSGVLTEEELKTFIGFLGEKGVLK